MVVQELVWKIMLAVHSGACLSCSWHIHGYIICCRLGAICKSRRYATYVSLPSMMWWATAEVSALASYLGTAELSLSGVLYHLTPASVSLI